MDQNSLNTRRIAKNTLMLYIRMLFMMFLGLFTSRIVLEALGENDYGIYNVVGGVVAMFSLISGSLTTSVTRFITFEMGKGETAQLNKVYSTSVMIQFILAVIVVILAEPIGIWFIENKMTIMPDRIPAAQVVMHFSLLTFVVNLMSVPQMASITAHEQMSAYAYIGILDGSLRFIVALMIARSTSDRLILYSALMAAVVFVIRLCYGIYCRRHFPECRYKPVFQKGLVKEMFSFAGWNFIGASSGILRDQGGNILVNLFSGPSVNAARGVAVQLNGAIQSFVTNFMTAVNPQITKSYASGDHDYMFYLISKSSRMSYYLLFVLALPVLFNTEYVMSLWLKDVPEHAVLFVQLFLIFTLSECISQPLITAMYATGKIRDYQIIVGGLQLLNLPISYILLKLGAIPEVTVIVAIAVSQICYFSRLIMLKKMVGLKVGLFIRNVYLNVIKVTVIAVALSYLYRSIPIGSFGLFCLNAFLCFATAGMSVFYIGCSNAERRKVMKLIKYRIGNDNN